MKTQNVSFYRCCYGYAVSGMVTLSFGAILPSLIEEAGMNYALAGGLLSFMAIGNLLASFIYPAVAGQMGHKRSMTIAASMVPVCLLGFTLLPSILVMYVLIFLLGISRGSITLINNLIVNKISGGSGKELNLLHCSFAVGAFLSPFMIGILISAGIGWKVSLCMLAALAASSAISYHILDYRIVPDPRLTEKRKGWKQGEIPKDRSFLKNSGFYCIAFLLFFYLGTENCINGWFVTYLQSTGVMSEAFATTMVSVTWLVIMAGRLVCARLSKSWPKKKIILMDAFGSALCFFLLIATKSLPVITISLAGLGFFLAGIYPTSIANAGSLIMGSTVGMSILTAISAVGGIITPQIIGMVADQTGMTAPISTLSVNVILVCLLAIFNYRRPQKTSSLL